MSWALLVVFVCLWAGTALLIRAWGRRLCRPNLSDRLQPFSQPWVADEAQDWLDDQR